MKDIEIKEVTPIVGSTNVKVIYKKPTYSEEELKEAWEASERNMRNTFSSSAYKNVSFDEWFKTIKKQ